MAFVLLICSLEVRPVIPEVECADTNKLPSIFVSLSRDVVAFGEERRPPLHTASLPVLDAGLLTLKQQRPDRAEVSLHADDDVMYERITQVFDLFAKHELRAATILLGEPHGAKSDSRGPWNHVLGPA